MEFTIKLMEAKVEQAVKLKDEKSETVETNEIDVEENNNLSIVPKTVGTDSSQPQEAALISKRQKKMNKRMQQRFAAVQKKHPAGSSNEINRPRIPPLKIKLSEIFKRKHKKRSGVKSKKIVPGKVLSTEGKSDDETADEVESLESKSQLKECFVKLERCDEGAIRIKLEPSEEIPDAPLEVDKTNFLAISNVYSDFPMDFESGEVKLEVEATNMSQAVVPTEPDKMVMRRVSHMCYSINQGILVYRCRLCPYEDSLKFQFEKHLKQLHRNHRWFGSCMTCSTDPTSETGTLFDELKHMFYAHILTETVLITNLPAKPAPMVSIPYDSLIRLKPPKIDELGCNLLSAGKTLKKLRPWLHAAKVSHQKIADDCEAMLKIVCLNALFKCMSVGCSFYTNDDDLFRTHLALHMKHQGADIKNFSQCSYCPFSAQSCAQLVEHVVNEHGSDRYQCSYCFFRSYDLQIDTHQKLYHAVKKFNIIKCHQTVMKSSSKELEAVWENCQTNLPGMSCMVCKKKFYNFEQFISHLHTHDNFPSSKCLKCGEIILFSTIDDHLKNCHGFGIIQCCFCRFGTDLLGSYLIHIANCHPSKMPLFFDRSNSPASATTFAYPTPRKWLKQRFALKEFVLQPTRSCVMKESSPPELMRNERNVHKLSRNYHIKALN